jgi:hypothetical protein
VRGNSIVEQAADPVDVFGDRDRQQDFVRSDSRLRRHDISCRRAVFGVGADGPVENSWNILAVKSRSLWPASKHLSDPGMTPILTPIGCCARECTNVHTRL